MMMSQCFLLHAEQFWAASRVGNGEGLPMVNAAAEKARQTGACRDGALSAAFKR